MQKIADYYKRDQSAVAVDKEVLLAQLSETIRNPKHVERFDNFLTQSAATGTSEANVRAVILLAKQQEVGDRLAQALAVDAGADKVDAYLEELQTLRKLTSLEELGQAGSEVFDDSLNLSDMIKKEMDPEGLIKLYPSSLNDRVDGGVRKGHHILVFAPVEAGKSCTVINMSAGFARQKLKTLYFINEDRPQDIIIRLISNLSGMTKHQIHDDPQKAQQLGLAAGFSQITVISCSPGSPRMIEEYIDKYKPDCVVVDQLRNLQVKADTRVNQLEMAATAMRNIAKKKNVLMVSVTQAGDSASDKLVLQMGDVDFSNVGIPSQMDVMIGLGMNAAYELEGLRHMTLCKNKISGDHSNFPVKIHPQLSRITSV